MAHLARRIFDRNAFFGHTRRYGQGLMDAAKNKTSVVCADLPNPRARSLSKKIPTIVQLGVSEKPWLPSQPVLHLQEKFLHLELRVLFSWQKLGANSYDDLQNVPVIIVDVMLGSRSGPIHALLEDLALSVLPNMIVVSLATRLARGDCSRGTT